MADRIEVGCVYSSFADFESTFSEHQKKYVFVKKQTKSVDAANKTIKNAANHYPKEWVYYGVTFLCKHYGSYDVTSQGGQRHTDTFKTGCTAKVRLQANKSKNGLVVTEANLEHTGHGEIKCAEDASLYPEKRKMNSPQQREMKLFLDNKVTVPRIIEHFKKTSDMCLNSYDVWNHKRRLDMAKSNGKSDDELTRDVLLAVGERDPGASVDVVTDPITKETQIIAIQTQEMKSHFAAYPSMLFIDGTYKVNNRNMPLYSFMVVDGNHQGQVVCYALVIRETEDVLTKVLQILSKNNEDAVQSLETVVVDKDYSEINSVKSVFQTVNVVLCKWHVDRAIQKQLTGRRSEDKDDILKIIRALLKSSTEEEYDNVYSQLTSYPIFKMYFDTHWHSIRSQWAGYCVRRHLTFGNLTNNFVESHNHKLKQFLGSSTSIPDLLGDIVNFSKRISNKSKALKRKLTLKKSIVPLAGESDFLKEAIRLIYDLCTPYAARAIEQQALMITHKIFIVRENLVESPNGKAYTVTDSGKCSCFISESQQLLCAHVMAYRKEHGLPLVVPADIPRQYLKAHFLNALGGEAGKGQVTVGGMPGRSTLSQNEKYRKAFSCVRDIADVLSTLNQSEFDAHCDMFRGIVSAIKQRKNVMYFVSEDYVQFDAGGDDHSMTASRGDTDWGHHQLSSVSATEPTIAAAEGDEEEHYLGSVSAAEPTTCIAAAHEDQLGSVNPSTTEPNLEDAASLPLENTDSSALEIQLPVKLKKRPRGRPKQNKKLVAKRQRLQQERDTIEKILRDLVDSQYLESVLSHTLFIDSSMLLPPEDMSPLVAHVDESKIHHFFTFSGWLAFQNMLKELRQH